MENTIQTQMTESSHSDLGKTKTYKQKEIEERLTPEQRDLIYKLMHPEGDPYGNARDLGFYCEQCG